MLGYTMGCWVTCWGLLCYMVGVLDYMVGCWITCGSVGLHSVMLGRVLGYKVGIVW